MTKTALITGSSHGIGKAIAEELLKASWTVVGLDKDAASIQNKNYQHHTVNLADMSALEKVYDNLNTSLTSLHLLVHNAAFQTTGSLEEISLQNWDLTMDVNVKSVFVSTKKALPLLRKAQGASIVNIASVHAYATSQSISAYAASKGALTAFTRACALELAGDKIHVNSICPGAIDTDMLRAGFDRAVHSGGSVDKMQQNLADKHPVKKIGEPRDIAKLVMFLADSENIRFITGQSFTLDGGALARLSTE
jgi:NAD(P)-dependent dehydrogenase (short-subunit alcohol dehydrogenase family)